MKMLIELLRANLKETMRDLSMLVWMLLFPVVFALIFGLIYSNVDMMGKMSGKSEISTINIGVVDETGSEIGNKVIAGLEAIDVFAVSVGTQDEAYKAFLDGEKNLVIVLPAEMKALSKGDPHVDIAIYYDDIGANALYGVKEVLSSLEQDVNETSSLFEMQLYNATTGYDEKLQEYAETHNIALVEEVQSANAIDYILPGVLAMTIMQLGLFGSGRIIGMRTSKLLKTLGVTPVSRKLFIASEILVRLFMAVIQALIIILIGHFMFGLTIVGNWLCILGWIILGAATFISIGYMLTTFSKTPDSCNAIVQVIHLPMLFLSGIFITKDIMPSFMAYIVDCNPLAYLADAFRSVMIGSAPVYGWAMDYGVIIGLLIITFVITVKRFKWE